MEKRLVAMVTGLELKNVITDITGTVARQHQ